MDGRGEERVAFGKLYRLTLPYDEDVTESFAYVLDVGNLPFGRNKLILAINMGDDMRAVALSEPRRIRLATDISAKQIIKTIYRSVPRDQWGTRNYIRLEQVFCGPELAAGIRMARIGSSAECKYMLHLEQSVPSQLLANRLADSERVREYKLGVGMLELIVDVGWTPRKMADYVQKIAEAVMREQGKGDEPA